MAESKNPRCGPLSRECQLRKDRLARLRKERCQRDRLRREQLQDGRPRIGEPPTWRHAPEHEYLGHQVDEFIG